MANAKNLVGNVHGLTKQWQERVSDSLGLVTVAVLTELASTAMSPKLVPNTLDVSPLVKADWYADALELSPLKNTTVVATVTDPAVTLSTVTCTGLPDNFSMLVVRVATNCKASSLSGKLNTVANLKSPTSE